MDSKTELSQCTARIDRAKRILARNESLIGPWCDDLDADLLGDLLDDCAVLRSIIDRQSSRLADLTRAA